MEPLELVEKYMEIIFSEGSLEDLIPLLAADLKFKGPLFEFDSANDYVESLKSNPPVGFHHNPIKTFVNDSSVCIIYKFSKFEISTPMAQFFEIKKGLISSILLIFDRTDFT